jgi:hypothetical protein
MLTVDIAPRDSDVSTTLKLTSELPEDCAARVYGAKLQVYYEPSINALGLDIDSVLQAARFCHPTVYLEDRCLERHGCRYCCCQPAASAAHFFGGVICLPLMMWQFPCYDCVRTPMPIGY